MKRIQTRNTIKYLLHTIDLLRDNLNYSVIENVSKSSNASRTGERKKQKYSASSVEHS